MLASRFSSTYDMFEDAVRQLERGSEREYHEICNHGPLAQAFMSLWDSKDAADALSYLKYMEIKTNLRKLQQEIGRWEPPPEVATYLKKQPKPAQFSTYPNDVQKRNLKFVLHILGVPTHDNKPFTEFLKAKTTRQKRYWLYKYMGPAQAASDGYLEPICETRLKRLYQFFPNRFKEDNGIIYFNSKMLLYKAETNRFYLGTQEYFLDDDWDDPDSSEDSDSQVLMWRKALEGPGAKCCDCDGTKFLGFDKEASKNFARFQFSLAD